MECADGRKRGQVALKPERRTEELKRKRIEARKKTEDTPNEYKTGEWKNER